LQTIVYDFLSSQENWLTDINDEAIRVHWACILTKILDVEGDRGVNFINSIKSRKQLFAMQG